MEARPAALAFLRRTIERLADRLTADDRILWGGYDAEVWPIDHGWVVRSPSLGLVWARNQVRLDRPLAYEEAAVLAR
jgi:hypothetical protein